MSSLGIAVLPRRSAVKSPRSGESSPVACSPNCSAMPCKRHSRKLHRRSSTSALPGLHDSSYGVPSSPIPVLPPAKTKQRPGLSISILPLKIEPQSSEPFTSRNDSFGLIDGDQQITQANPYLHGPILVCEPSIYLFSEPTFETVMDFDVVINVAKEVRPPFKNVTPVFNSSTYGDESRVSDKSAFAELYPSSDSSLSEGLVFSPNTSGNTSPSSSLSATSCSSLSDLPEKPPHLEYIYVPWDHSSNLSGDLNMLTRLIGDRSNQNKKILIHCQCGVSRSASLVVAYVMRSQKVGLNTAYQNVKKLSPSISPNMTLMFQLMDWWNVIRSDEGDILTNDDDLDF